MITKVTELLKKNHILYKLARVTRKYYRKIYYIINMKKALPNLTCENFDKVIFVAHPDDEIIFFGSYLLNEPGWLVVCLTNGGNHVRLNEFISVMKAVGAQYLIWNFPDGQNVNWDKSCIERRIADVLKLKDHWKKVLTHNAEGEYGHPQHIELHHIIKQIYLEKNLFVPVNRENLVDIDNMLSIGIMNKKRKIINNFYQSQRPILDDLKDFYEYERIIKI